MVLPEIKMRFLRLSCSGLGSGLRDLSDSRLYFEQWKHLGLTLAPLIHLSLLVSSSPDMPENEATFAISAGGVTDAKEWRIKG